MGRHQDEYDDEYDDDEHTDDEHDDEPPGRARQPGRRATLGDPMAGGGHFVKPRREPHQLRVPAKPAAPRPATAAASAATKAGSVDALARIREQRDRESFRKGFIYGAAVVGGACALIFAVIVLTDGGHARRAEMAQIELARVQALAEDGDLEAGELRRAEIMALIAGPFSADEQLELARQHNAMGQLSDAELAWVQRASDMAGEGPVNAKILEASTGSMGAVLAAGDTGPDVFTKDKKTVMTKEDIRAMEAEDLDGRDLGLGKLARTQRQNRKTMQTANQVGKSMLKVAGKDADDADVQGAIEAHGIK